MEKIEPVIGMMLKRKFHNYGEVIVTSVGVEHVGLKDANGQHYIRNKNLHDFFTVIEPTLPHIEEASMNNNIDDPKRHSISGGANNPSDMQKYAFDKETKND